MYRRREVESEWGFVWDVLKIALGVFIGCMIAVFTYENVLAWRAEQAAKQVMQKLKESEDKQKQAEQQRLQLQKEQQDKQRRQALERDWQRQQQALAAKRKEQAWEKFYQPSNTCREDSARVDCANAHIKTREAFEAQYRDD